MRYILSLCCLSSLFPVLNSAAQDVFQDDFNSDSSSAYRVLHVNPDRDGVSFAFNYGELGIPASPNSTDTQNRGLQLWANHPAGGTAGGPSAVQIVPQGVGSALVGKSYRVSFDVWMNSNGPLPAGNGSTAAWMAGVGWNGAKPIEIGAQNGTYMAVSGNAGPAPIIRAVTNAGVNADGVLTGPSGDTTDPFYRDIFPGGLDVASLAIQGGQDAQMGVTSPGQAAFSWHSLAIEVSQGSARFFIDDLLVAHAANPDLDLKGSVMLGYGDYLGIESDAPQWSFGVVDNLRVTIIPEPSGYRLLLLGGLSLLWQRQRKSRLKADSALS